MTPISDNFKNIIIYIIIITTIFKVSFKKYGIEYKCMGSGGDGGERFVIISEQ